MSRRNLEDHLSSYYEKQSLPCETVERLTALAAVGEAAPEASAARGWSTQAVFALAACVALVSIAGTRLMLGAAAGDRRPATITGTPTNGNPQGLLVRADEQPRFIAVKFEAAGCPNARATEKIFARCEQEYGNQCVLFQRLDITDQTKSQQAKYLAHLLGIDCVMEDGACKSGTLVLVDRETSKLLAVATCPQQAPKFESALAAAIK